MPMTHDEFLATKSTEELAQMWTAYGLPLEGEAEAKRVELRAKIAAVADARGATNLFNRCIDEQAGITDDEEADDE